MPKREKNEYQVFLLFFVDESPRVDSNNHCEGLNEEFSHTSRIFFRGQKREIVTLMPIHPPCLRTYSARGLRHLDSLLPWLPATGHKATDLQCIKNTQNFFGVPAYGQIIHRHMADNTFRIHNKRRAQTHTLLGV